MKQRPGLVKSMGRREAMGSPAVWRRFAFKMASKRGRATGVGYVGVVAEIKKSAQIKFSIDSRHGCRNGSRKSEDLVLIQIMHWCEKKVRVDVRNFTNK